MLKEQVATIADQLAGVQIKFRAQCEIVTGLEKKLFGLQSNGSNLGGSHGLVSIMLGEQVAGIAERADEVEVENELMEAVICRLEKKLQLVEEQIKQWSGGVHLQQHVETYACVLTPIDTCCSCHRGSQLWQSAPVWGYSQLRV